MCYNWRRASSVFRRRREQSARASLGQQQQQQQAAPADGWNVTDAAPPTCLGNWRFCPSSPPPRGRFCRRRRCRCRHSTYRPVVVVIAVCVNTRRVIWPLLTAAVATGIFLVVVVVVRFLLFVVVDVVVSLSSPIPSPSARWPVTNRRCYDVFFVVVRIVSVFRWCSCCSSSLLIRVVVVPVSVSALACNYPTADQSPLLRRPCRRCPHRLRCWLS